MVKAYRKLKTYSQVSNFHLQQVESCTNWLKRQAEEIGLEFNVKHFDPPPGFAVWLTWKGSEPQLESVMFNSHMDVVPVDIVY